MKESKRILTADTVVDVTIETKARTIEWSDIKIAVELDDRSEAPWEDCDGLEHDIEWLKYRPDDGREDSQGYFSRGRDCGIVSISDAQVKAWGFNQDEFYAGASKQVSREMFAQVKRKNLAQLVEWYTNGWQYYGGIASYGEHTESCWGFDTEESAREFAETDGRSEIAAALEKEGFIIANEPAPDANRLSSADLLRDRIRRNLAYAYAI